MLSNKLEKQVRSLKQVDACKIPLKDRVSVEFEPRCRPWYSKAIENPGITIGVPPYVDQYSKSIVTTFSKAFTV